MKDEGSRTTLRSRLADSGVPPEKFLEALDIVQDEIRALLESAGSAAPASLSAPAAEASENDTIRRILEELKARWIQQDRAKARAEASPSPPPTPAATPPAPQAPPAVSRDADRITLETVVLKGPAGGRAPLRPSAEEQAEEPLLETIAKRPGGTPAGARPPQRSEPPPPPGPEDDQPTTFIGTGQPAPPPETAEKGPEEDDLAKTVILRPDQIRPKGKGGSR